MDFLNTPEKLNRRMVHCPMGRFGEAVELAKSVVFRESLRAGVTLPAASWPPRCSHCNPPSPAFRPGRSACNKPRPTPSAHPR